MTEVTQALDDMKALYTTLLGGPAPEITAGWSAPFPPGVDPLAFAVQEVRDLEQLATRMQALPRTVAFIPRADLFAAKDALVIRVEVPGVAKDGLKVLVDEGECIVRGERKPFEISAELRPIGIELAYGSFERRFALPRHADTAKLTAKVADGVLEVRIPIEAEAAPKEMKVEVA